MAEPAPVLVGRRPRTSPEHHAVSNVSVTEDQVTDEKTFTRMLYLERKRAERANGGFILLLLESASLLRVASHERAVDEILSTVSSCTRETDIKGWYKEHATIGVIFTEIGIGEGQTVATMLLTRIKDALRDGLAHDEMKNVNISCHVFPEPLDANGERGDIDLALYPELTSDDGKKPARLLKRVIDVLGSVAALILFLPLLLAIAVAIKMTSKGPIIFKQARVGLRGAKFTFYKFRTMYCGNDQTIHKEYTKRLITGRADAADPVPDDEPLYKIKNDPRVTAIGTFLRRTSLDEFPQFFNVLKGDMSLVGPRPPIPYEVEAYAPWHRRRFLLVKPGITGPWQVAGRSRVKFDDMVRLDLRYAKSWSVLEDLKIILKTPKAVMSGNGAY